MSKLYLQQQQWFFQPCPNLIFPLLVYGFLALCILAIFLYLLLQIPFDEVWLIVLMAIGILVWLCVKISRELRLLYHWNGKKTECICLNHDSLYFHVYPHSGSLKYTEIEQVVHWYEQRTANRRAWDEDVGIIIFTPERQIKLNLERMVQSDDDITFGSNSHIVIHELNKRIRAFQAA